MSCTDCWRKEYCQDAYGKNAHLCGFYNFQPPKKFIKKQKEIEYGDKYFKAHKDLNMHKYKRARIHSMRKYIHYINTIREKISLWLAVIGISALFCIPITFTACQIETGNAFLYSKDYLIVCFYAILLIFIGLILYPQSKFKISINECITEKKCKEKKDLYVDDGYGGFTKIGEITRRKARDKFLTEHQK